MVSSRDRCVCKLVKSSTLSALGISLFLSLILGRSASLEPTLFTPTAFL